MQHSACMCNSGDVSMLSDGENNLKICLLISTEYMNVVDERTDTARRHMHSIMWQKLHYTNNQHYDSSGYFISYHIINIFVKRHRQSYRGAEPAMSTSHDSNMHIL